VVVAEQAPSGRLADGTPFYGRLGEIATTASRTRSSVICVAPGCARSRAAISPVSMSGRSTSTGWRSGCRCTSRRAHPATARSAASEPRRGWRRAATGPTRPGGSNETRPRPVKRVPEAFPGEWWPGFRCRFSNAGQSWPPSGTRRATPPSARRCSGCIAPRWCGGAARPAGMSGKRWSKAAPMARAVRGAIASTTSGPCARPTLAAGTPPLHAGRLPARILSSPPSFTAPAPPAWTPVRCRPAPAFVCGGAARRAGTSGRPRSRTAPTASGRPGARPARERSYLHSDRWRPAIPICTPSGTARATASWIRLRSVPVRGDRPGGAAGPAGTSGRPASNRTPSTAPAAQPAMQRGAGRRSAPAASSCLSGTLRATTN
jgi:hypothetical protein